MMSRAERTPLQLAQSTINLLNLLIFLKIFLLVTSISFISVALFGKEDQMGSKHVALRDRAFLLHSGLYVGCVSLVAGIANALALLGLKLWRRALLVPYLACLVFGAMYSLCYVLEAIFIFGVKDVALIAAICGFLSCCVLLSHIFPVFLVMTLPRPIMNTTASSLLASPNSSDNPPGYETLMAGQLPGYDDSIVQKTQVGVTMEQEKEKAASLSTTLEA